jgi:hypothetical protein
MCFLSNALFVELRPRCGLADVFLNVRAADWFLVTPQAAPRAMYEVFVAR